MSERGADGGGAETPTRRWHRYILAPTLLLVAVALAALPFVVASMVAEFRGGQAALYDLRGGRPIGPGETVNPGGREFLNVAVVDLNEATGSLTLAISGNRSCNPCASPKQMTFFALDADVGQRRGITPFATVTVPAGQTTYSQRVTLPVRGSPIRYPFDTYQVRLGLDLPPPESQPAGGPTNNQVLGTLESQLTRFVMDAPVLVASASPTTQTSPTPGLVLDLAFHRPVYLPALATLLVVFVAVSSALALATQPIDGLLLGLGGLILAIWGVRSVLVPSWLEAITAVDLALSGVILLLLVGVAVRAALHLHRRAGLHLPRLRRRT
ncbi:MAG TPA: hypothetical protein VFU81_12890 [Thermomicrobiales bacterium]|nr:hypothetical protein [Thermomicrobiales bacterium]